MRPDPERLSHHEAHDLDEAVEAALDGSTRAEELQGYVKALQSRQDILARDLEASQDAGERAVLQTKLDEIDGQIQVLREEENINRFVEDAVKFSYEVRRLSEG